LDAELKFYTFTDEQLIEYSRDLYHEKGIEAFRFEYLSTIGNLYNNLYKRGITLNKLIDMLGLREEYSQFKSHQQNPSLEFSSYTKEQLVDYCRNVYFELGISGLSYVHLKKLGNLYNTLYHTHKMNMYQLIDVLGVRQEYDEYKAGLKKWSTEKILQHGRSIIEEFGYLPPAEWLRKNGYGAMVTALYGSDISFADLRDALSANEGSSFVMSKNGMRWRSHPEASFSNFLYARGIEHELGRKYPDDYAAYSKRRYGYYDIQFLDKDGNSVDVEIWGDKPNGFNPEFYAHKRKIKERYNRNNASFLGVEFKDCFDEERLSQILEPYIGVIEPYIFEKPTDKIIPSTHWSNADELIDYCREFVKQFPNQEFPTEEWLRKRGKWAKREGEAYNTLSVYIKTWIGGVRKLREILNQSHVSTIVWDKESALEEYRKWYEQYQLTPGTCHARYLRGQIHLSEEESKRCTRIRAAVSKHVGSETEAKSILGIVTTKPYRVLR